ncbi:T9SS type A sorting domain-containing protein [Zunongwangia sp. H14]|uniref:T9SS type A sorting domain-containing protein n=1 Tax=Zunongwangia sp. H14 TaxID=3240792 RepID=UPI0035699D06
MKYVVKLLFVTLLLGISFNVKAADDLAVKVKEKTLLVEVGNSYEEGTLSLQDEQGKVLFKDGLMEDGSYTKSLNLADAPQGVYYLQFENKYHIYTKVITKNEEGIHVEEKTSEITFKPTFKIEDKKVRFSLANPSEGVARVKIYNALGELVATTEGKGTVVTKTIDFKKVPNGEYTIEIDTKNNHFIKTVNFG